jgi:hypothetical protein
LKRELTFGIIKTSGSTGDPRAEVPPGEFYFLEEKRMKRKIFYSVIILILLFTSITVGAFAPSGTQKISAVLNNAIKFTLNGSGWTPKDANGKVLSPITYNNINYLPVRAVAEATGMTVVWDGTTQTIHLSHTPETYDTILEFPADQYPQVAAHIASAILAGKSSVCTIDRNGAEERREASLSGIPARDGFDRDEWPMAMCAEGGVGASVAYIDPSENRGAGSWVGNELEKYPDGTRVKFVITFGDRDADAQRKTSPQPAQKPADEEIYYKSCAEARAAGATPLRAGDPGYGRHLDRDGDGIACE